jgi:hypothetical protein
MATKKVTKSKPKKARRIVLVRSGQSGVWIGVYVGSKGDAVSLTEARKIWRWRGANTTSELALRGCVKEYSRIAEPTTVIVYAVCEMHDSNETAFAAVCACGWAP